MRVASARHERERRRPPAFSTSLPSIGAREVEPDERDARPVERERDLSGPDADLEHASRDRASSAVEQLDVLAPWPRREIARVRS